MCQLPRLPTKLGSNLSGHGVSLDAAGLSTPIGARRPQRGAAGGHLREHRDDQEANRGGVCAPRRLRDQPQVEPRHRRDPQDLPGARRRGDHLPASPRGAEPQRRALRGHRLQPASPAGDTRPTRAVPLAPLLCPGRRCGGEPGSRTRWSSSSNSAALAGCWDASPCHGSGTPWSPTSTSSGNCWSDRQRPPRVHTCSPVLLLMVARVLWTARPPARPGLGAEATMAEPAGPMTFRCPFAVHSTCPPACCTAATISLASLERQRFGAACFFSAIPDDLSIPPTRPRPHRGQGSLCTQAPVQRAARGATPRRPAGTGRWIFVLGPRMVRAATVVDGRRRSATVTSGEEYPQVGWTSAQPASTTPGSGSDCGPGGHPLWHPSTLPTGITGGVLRFGLPVRRVRADGCRWYPPAGGLGRTGREHQGRTLVSGPRRWWAPAWDGLGRSRTGHG